MENSSGIPVGRILSILSHHYFGAITRKLNDMDIDRHFSIILVLAKEKACTQQYLSSLLRMDKVSMVRVLDYLVKAGYVVRKSNPRDRREHLVSLTEKGKKNVPRIREAVKETDKVFMKGMNVSEKKDFRRYLDVISGNLEGLPANKFVFNYRKIKNGK